MSTRIRKVVIPAAGFGTRLLPWTKIAPKEAIPVAFKPVIQHAIEEAVASGITEVIIVTQPDRTTVADYFRPAPALENFLREHGKNKEAEMLRSLSSLANISVVSQHEQLGLAHAVRAAREAIAGEPFALLLPDALILSARPCLRQLLDRFDVRPACYIAAAEVRPQHTVRFGILDPAESITDGVFRVRSLVEKPLPADAPSHYGVFGRYLLTPEIFDAIEQIGTGRGGEYQLTDALRIHAGRAPVYGAVFEGEHFDVGDKLEYLLAVVEFALRDPELADPLRHTLASRLASPASHS